MTEALHPLDTARNLALLLQRLAAEAAGHPDFAPGDRARLAAGAAVKGAVEELEARLPGLDGALEAFLRDLGRTLARLAHEAAERPGFSPGERAELAVRALVRGLFKEVRALVPDLQATTTVVLERVREALESTAEEAAARAGELRSPGDRARLLADGFVRGAVSQGHEALPQVAQDLEQLAAPLSRLAAAVGSGLAEGINGRADEMVLASEILVDRCARALVHAAADQLAAEGARLAQLRPGLSQAAGVVLGPQAGDGRTSSALRRASHELFAGACSALGEGLRRPARLAALGAGAAALALGIAAAVRR